MRNLLSILAFLLLPLAQAEKSPVLINEFMYHPPDGQDMLQYVELLNRGTEPVDVSNWNLSGAIKFKFPAQTVLPAQSFVVVCRNTSVFQKNYGTAAVLVGNFAGKFKHKGGILELTDGAGQSVESLRFTDKSPWPLGADGYGGSLERICATAPSDDPHNWATSRLGKGGKGLGGSPGRTNDSDSPFPLPQVENVHWQKILQPKEPLVVSVKVRSSGTNDAVTLHYKIMAGRKPALSVDLPMKRVSGTSRNGAYEGTIPSPPAGSLVRFTVSVLDQSGVVRVAPGETEPQPAYSAFVYEDAERASIPQITIVNSETLRGSANKFAPAKSGSGAPGTSALLYVPAKGEVQLFDFVQVRRRSGGLKIHCLRDQPVDEMTAFNLIFEGSERWILSEYLSYELFRKAGVKLQKSGHARLTVDGRHLGYYLMVEQPNKNFLARSGRDEEGNLYKVLWFGRNVVDQHEKKTNPESGHGDILRLIETLRSKSGEAQWTYINEQLNVDAFVSYYAVNMCIQNWDGFFNNHFLYHDTKAGGKWDVIPWDEDKTWGEYDGGPADYSWYDMPLTIGMDGDRAPRAGWFGGGPFGGVGWWRPAGALSGPLLANAQFRKKLETRVKALCATVFSPEAFGPVVKELQQRLRPEVELKARGAGQDPAAVLRRFDTDIESFHRQLAHRRKFLLAQLNKSSGQD